MLLGVEHFRIVPGTTVVTPLDFVSYPYSHSLLFDLLWAVALAVVWWLLRRDRRAALVLGLGVLSHWVLDVVSHRPDMPVLPSWTVDRARVLRSLGATLVVEGALFAVGLALYLKSTRALDRFGRLGPALLVGLLLAAYLGGAPRTAATRRGNRRLGGAGELDRRRARLGDRPASLDGGRRPQRRAHLTQ